MTDLELMTILLPQPFKCNRPKLPRLLLVLALLSGRGRNSSMSHVALPLDSTDLLLDKEFDRGRGWCTLLMTPDLGLAPEVKKRG